MRVTQEHRRAFVRGTALRTTLRADSSNGSAKMAGPSWQDHTVRLYRSSPAEAPVHNVSRARACWAWLWNVVSSMRILFRVLDYVFGCHHGNLSRVFTIEGRTYRVCCGCGAKFDYSL